MLGGGGGYSIPACTKATIGDLQVLAARSLNFWAGP